MQELKFEVVRASKFKSLISQTGHRGLTGYQFSLTTLSYVFVSSTGVCKPPLQVTDNLSTWISGWRQWVCRLNNSVLLKGHPVHRSNPGPRPKIKYCLFTTSDRPTKIGPTQSFYWQFENNFFYFEYFYDFSQNFFQNDIVY